MKIVGIIPARYASSRFPGKPLAPIAGKPLIQRVVEQCQLASTLSEMIVATDDQRIFDAVRDHCRVEMTDSRHPNGTDRIAEVAARIPCDGAVNIQGDEPMIDPLVIDTVAQGLSKAGMTTAATPISTSEDYADPNVTKVVVSHSGHALLFSRRTIPYLREAARESVDHQLRQFPFLKHLGIYGYRCETLQRLVNLPVSPLEKAECLEQLRALENDIAIQVFQVNYESIGVDIPEDVAKVESILNYQRSSV
ncbi:MAG: 3-deoxy-manno-octulosonate cytidylyltransferase [Verrucomicrobia subdivision 3 bacterium]|nr:3-deoxy-manno-octulosonate cytidylyltransferase [Limisphaerales bacterium]MCS1415883.1 3-deoxy-manno-octulosonate cytidylyltransferase [Limisphaerales bacterium]